jgi:hypothetical protein
MEQQEIRKILEETLSSLGGSDRTYTELIKALTKDKTLKFASRPLPGQMLFFKYEPVDEGFLNKVNTYYDVFPLILLTDVTRHGFEGINLHYLDTEKRKFLFESITDSYPILKSTDQISNRVSVDYRSLKSRRRMRFFKPCYRKYRWEGMKRRPILVPFPYWKPFVEADTGFFIGKRKPSVYRDSNTKIARGNL